MNIPGYQLGREIVAGEYCSIYNALDIETSKTVTVKYFHSVLSSNEAFCQHVRNVSGKLLNRPLGHLITLKNVVWDPQGCYLITDYFPCHNQTSLETKFTIGEVLDFGLQIAASLSQLHQLGVVHGGVSTDNLVFPNLSEVSLGLVAFQRTLENPQVRHELPVTLQQGQYIAPEFNQGLTAASDFYSLGVVLYELLFKQIPFSAQRSAELLQQKMNRDYTITSPAAQKLAPLFDQLLHPQPSQRISSVDEYIATVEQCGFELELSALLPDEEQPKLEEEPSATVEPAKKPGKQLKIAAAASLLLILVIIYLWRDDGSQSTATNDRAIATRNQTEASDTSSPTRSAVKTDHSQQRARTLLKLSRKQLSQNKIAAALMSINKALKEDPRLAPAQSLKQQIERELEIRAMLGRADKQIEQGKILAPRGDNALHTYRQLARLLPAEDNRAHDAIKKLADRYYRAANALVQKKDFAGARQQIEKGLGIAPDHARLQQLALYIRQQETAAELQKKKLLAAQQSAQRAREQKAKQARQQKRQAALEAKRRQQQALLKRQRVKAEQKAREKKIQQEKARQAARKQQREKELAAQKARQQRQIDEKLAAAQQLLDPRHLSLQSLSRALLLQSELTDQSLSDERIPDLYHRIVEAYGVLAQRQKEAAQYQAALTTVERGLSIDNGNKNLQRIRDEIVQARIAAEREKKNVPIIGTF